MNASVRGKPMIKEKGALDMLKGVGHLLSLITNGVEIILIIRIYEKQGIMMLSLKQTKPHWSYDLKSAWIRSVIAVKVALEGDETDLKNSGSHRITAQGALLGAIKTLMFLMSLKIGSFHTFLTVMVGAVFFFLRASRPVFLHKTEKKIIVPPSSATLCVLFDFFLTWYSFTVVLRIHFVQLRKLSNFILFAYWFAWLGKVYIFLAERIEKQQTKNGEKISREYEDLWFTGKRDSNFDRHCHFLFFQRIGPPSQPMKFRLSPYSTRW